MLPSLTYREGETLTLGFEADEDAVKVVMIVKSDVESETAAFTAEAEFEDGEATISELLDFEPGEYIYQINYEYSDGSIEKYAKPEDCDSGNQDCEFPVLKICASLDMETS